jgi:chromate transporter
MDTAAWIAPLAAWAAQPAFGPAALGWAGLGALFAHFALLSLLAVGGAMSTAPEMQRWVVGEQGWLTDAQFTGSVALAQAAPGPNVLFVAVVGFNVAGLAGAAAAMVGSLLPSAVLAVWVAGQLQRHRQALWVRAFAAGTAPLTLGLLLAGSWVLLEPVLGPRPGTLAGAAAGLFPGAVPALALAAGTVALSLRTGLSPLALVAAGAVAGALGWV